MNKKINMKRPEKKDEKEQDSLKKYFGDIRFDRGYNQGRKDMIDYLPSEGEITGILARKIISNKNKKGEPTGATWLELKLIKNLTKAISKRIGK